jgi:hypothetical protein
MELDLIRIRRLLNGINSAFDDRCGILQFQPSISERQGVLYLSSNLAVTAKQGFMNGSLLVDNEELWYSAEKFFEEFPSEAVVRAFASHHQVANAIADDQGGDAFVREKKVLRFRIRKHCVLLR